MPAKKAAKKEATRVPNKKREKTSEQTVLSAILTAKKADEAPQMSESDWFELITASEILKDYDLSDEEITAGIVGDGGDGGIDSIFTMLNGELLSEDTEINSKQKRNSLSLVIIQSKVSPHFSEDSINRLVSVTEDLLDISNTLEDFAQEYNDDVRGRLQIFREAYLNTVATQQTLSITYCYATPGARVSNGVQSKANRLKSSVKGLFSDARCEVEFYTAQRLLELIRKVPSHKRTLELAEQPLATSSKSYVCLTPLAKYFEFISDNGKLARSIFESNVRDYQGQVPVNSAIRSTLSNPNSDDFWYLNNGVTIITPDASAAGKQITIEDPQIVNGLQTSYEIYEHFQTARRPITDTRTLLVRIIREQDSEARDRIIKATNSQTTIVPVSLRAAEPIHRNIEDYLRPRGFYYDRKKNFYKNQGKPRNAIVSIAAVAQAIMAVSLLRADSARARPTTLINRPADYASIFNHDTHVSIYLRALEIVKAVEAFLAELQRNHLLIQREITDIKYYVAMAVAVQLVGSQDNVGSKLTELDPFEITESVLLNAHHVVYSKYYGAGGDDKAAKGPDLNKSVLAAL